MMYEILSKWIILYDIGRMNILWYLSCAEAMARVIAGFSKRSNNVLVGDIGDLDGWLVLIAATCWCIDSIKN